SGIPNRVKRRYDIDYSILLNDELVQRDIADYLLFPPAVSPIESPKLMAVLSEENGHVKIDKFTPESIAEKAGMKKGDYILSLDNTNINNIEDVKLILFFCKPGDKLRVKIQRDKNLNIDILLTLK
ncbi:MAG: PDZ domain-containing protein, partial [Nitrospirae bacterium]|nr:PDZ domain-containing protein [Nitrospirota bacterium]